MKQGDVVLTPVPQAAGVIKNRPAIFLQELPPYRDLLVCGVSTQLPQDVKGFDEVVQSIDPAFGSRQSLLTLAVTTIPAEITPARMLKLPVAFGADADHV